MKIADLQATNKMKQIFTVGTDGPTKPFWDIWNYLLKNNDRAALKAIGVGYFSDDEIKPTEVDIPEELEIAFQSCKEWTENRNNPARIAQVLHPEQYDHFVIIIREDGEMFLAADNCDRHCLVYERYLRFVLGREQRTDVCGGGFIQVDTQKKEIKVHGSSGDYGRFCNLLVEILIRKAIKAEGFEDYTLVIEERKNSNY